MKISPTSLEGLLSILPEPAIDARGLFARTYCKKEFDDAGVQVNFVQCNISRNRRRGTIRGLHYQDAPFQEGKLVRCGKGRIFDVVVDLRADSPTKFSWESFILDAEDSRQLYIPPGFAHGFQTLEDNCDVLYQMSEYYEPTAARGILWDDPLLGIEWPIEHIVISDKDLSYKKLHGG